MANILVIEDSPDFAQFVCAVLELEGHRVRRATRLSEGTTLARSASASPSSWVQRPENADAQHAVSVI